jgi:CRP/FNR family transcriptional regulator, anaerobic regulatory protein
MQSMLNSLATSDNPTSARIDQWERAATERSLGLRSPPSRLDRTSTRRFLSKERVFCEGDPRTHVFQIEEGVVTIYRMLSDGRRQIIDFAYPGEFVGLGTTAEHFFSAEATSATRARCFSVGALEEAAAHDPSLGLQLYKAVSLELSAARALLIAIGQRSALERVATFLLMLSRRGSPTNGHDQIIHLAMRRADIGDFLGLTIETVSRTITKLRTMRIIEVMQGTEIRILNEELLEELSEGETTA